MSKNNLFNKLWKKLVHSISDNIGNNLAELRPINKDEIFKILIVRPNHRLGNMLLVTPIVKEVSLLFPSAHIDMFVKGTAADSIFWEYPNVKKIYFLPKNGLKYLFQYFREWVRFRQVRYDLVINVFHYSGSGRIATKVARGRHKFYGDEFRGNLSLKPGYAHLAQSPVLVLRQYLTRCGMKIESDTPIPLMDIKLTLAEKNHGRRKLSEITGNDKKTICLFTYATGNKCFPKEWWLPFYSGLKAFVPDYNIVEILNFDKVSQINHLSLTFYSQDIREIASVMAASNLFIGTDSGIMHLASSSSVQTIGLFSVTDLQIYGPYGNNSRSIQVSVGDHRSCLEKVKQILSTYQQ